MWAVVKVLIIVDYYNVTIMMNKEKPSIITANDVGWEYDNRIKYAVKIKTKNYHNFEVHLIHEIKPEININCIGIGINLFTN